MGAYSATLAQGSSFLADRATEQKSLIMQVAQLVLLGSRCKSPRWSRISWITSPGRAANSSPGGALLLMNCCFMGEGRFQAENSPFRGLESHDSKLVRLLAGLRIRDSMLSRVMTLLPLALELLLDGRWKGCGRLSNCA